MTRSPARGRVFHGWWIVLTAFVCHAVNTGVIFYAWGVFLAPLAETFGGRGRVANGFSILQFAAAAYSVGVGRVVDRRGARPVQLVGALVLATGFVLLSRVRSLPALYLCLAGPVAFGSTCIGNLPNNAAVARWFVRRRGRALGIATAGISAGGIVFAPLAQTLVTRVGWRTAFVVLGLLVAALVLPPVAAFMRRDPADLGLLPDGEPPPPVGGAELAVVEREIERSVRPEVAIRQRNFWLLAAAFSLTFAGLSSTLLFQAALLVDRGFSPHAASLVLGATAAMGVVGKLGFGALLDRFDQRRVAAVCFCLQAAGAVLLWRATSLPLLACYVVLYGYAMGGNATLVASLNGAAFGRLHYGAIAGRMSPFLVFAQGIGVPATGYLRDATGSYGAALGAVVVGSLAGAAIVLRVRLPRRGARARDVARPAGGVAAPEPG
ncbi:MAG TPA: MFS transporter [Candidatus Binatia bacterium]|nr:MFS transporter [Candidatus Binatia bacterium]